MTFSCVYWCQNFLKIGLCTIPFLFLIGMRWTAGVIFSWQTLLNLWIFVSSVLWIACTNKPYKVRDEMWVLPNTTYRLAALTLIAGGIYTLYNYNTLAAWIMIGGGYALLLIFNMCLADGQSIIWRIGIESAFTMAGGAIPVIIGQIETRFSDEEFFVLIEIIELTTFWITLRIITYWWPTFTQQSQSVYSFRRNQLALFLTVIAIGSLIFTLCAYQRSFFTPNAPGYPGISKMTPFLCGDVPSEPEIFDGKDIFRRLLDRVKTNPNKKSPEYGMLAICTGYNSWAQAFRRNLLKEAEEGFFTRPAGSIKSDQYLAAQRIYYYAKVRAAFPSLFTAEEDKKLHRWFETINKRALIVEWVDWLYALAFAKWPGGPYENQENGAGLLSLLELNGLAAVDLSPQNQKYVANNLRGWTYRFRNTDDAIYYQPKWIENSWFQFLYTRQGSIQNRWLSFEWLKLQALPDGRPLRYNHIDTVPLAGIAYFGTHLLKNPEYLWLAGRSLSYSESQGEFLEAQIGIEKAFDIIGHSPRQGTCLLYGDSGLPNQLGPLGPDKIVFRSGWSKDDTYLLLNLRFSGWHRYKATNTIILFYQAGPLIIENMSSRKFNWLPAGRSYFRDKRIPRENLNGLVVRKNGIGAVLYELIGKGSIWAQDPPYYARVERFETGSEFDMSRTVIEKWRGWKHFRTVYFYHNGLVIIVDNAQGSRNQLAALMWHLINNKSISENRILIRDGLYPVEMVLFPLGKSYFKIEQYPERLGEPSLQVQYCSRGNGLLQTVTVFLIKSWAGAEVNLLQEDHGPTLQVSKGKKHITLQLNEAFM